MVHIGRFLFFAAAFLFWTETGNSRCVLEEGQDLADVRGTLCSVNGLHTFGLATEPESDRFGLGLALDTDTSYFFHHRLSVHWKGYAKSSYKTFKKADPETNSIRVTDQAFIHIGHSLSDPIQIAIGRLPLPFGLHHEHLRYQLPNRNEMFWDRSVNGAVLTWRFRNDLLIDVGGTNKNSDDLADKEFSAFTLRATQHLDLLSGSKLIASYQNTGGRTVGKMGLAALVHHNEDLSSLEWARIADNWKTQTYAQLFRFVYQARDEEKLWTFEYDDIRRDSYRVALSFGRESMKNLFFGSSFQYERLRADNQSKWGFLVNLTYNATLQTNTRSWGRDE